MNLAHTKVFQGVLPALLQSNQAVMGRAKFITPKVREFVRDNLAASQYRHNIDEYLDDPVTVFAYPVFDSFEDDRRPAGVLATEIYWNYLYPGELV
jgi:hypothetical protein